MPLALTGGTVLTALHPPRLVSADVVVDAGRVTAVGTAPEGIPRRDCSGCLLIPGNVCAHTHLYSALARGMPYGLEPPRNFTQILQRVWWRLDRALDDEGVRASALAGAMDALLSGTTSLVDHHASPNAIAGSLGVIAEALEQIGVRSVLCYEVTDRDGPERARAGVEENRRFLKAARTPAGGPGGAHPLARGLVGAHASFTMSEETLAACVEVAREFGSGIHIHVAEDAADQRDAQVRFGRRVVQRLADAGALTERALLAHCIHVDEAEQALIRDSRATPLHNARSNMNNAVGHAPVGRLGDRLALGTDGIGGDMFAESRAAYWRAREDDVFLGPQWVLERLAEGARVAAAAFGEPSLGRIEPGAPADIAVLRYAPPTPLHDGNVAGHWVFGLTARQVRDVIVAGEVVVEDGRLTRVDQERLAARFREQAGRLWRRLEEIPAHPYEPAGAG